MAATPKPVRKEGKKILKGLSKMYKEDPDVKKAKFHPQEMKAMKKEDKKDVKRIGKAHHKHSKEAMQKAHVHMAEHMR